MRSASASAAAGSAWAAIAPSTTQPRRRQPLSSGQQDESPLSCPLDSLYLCQEIQPAPWLWSSRPAGPHSEHGPGGEPGASGKTHTHRYVCLFFFFSLSLSLARHERTVTYTYIKGDSSSSSSNGGGGGGGQPWSRQPPARRRRQQQKKKKKKKNPSPSKAKRGLIHPV